MIRRRRSGRNHPLLSAPMERTGTCSMHPRTCASKSTTTISCIPKKDLRHSPIMGAVLTNADVDHVAGLLNLRESQPLRIYATQRVLDVLQANSIFNVLNPKFVSREPMLLNEPLELLKPDGSSMDIRITPFAVPGKVALWLEDESKGKNFGSVDEDTIALYVEDTNNGKSFYYMPACARMTPELSARIADADLIFFDGTLWVDD